MLQTSLDLLLITISLAVLWLTVFLCVMLYYIIAILRQVYQAIKDWKEGLKKIGGILDLIKEKIEHTTSSLILVAEGIKQVIEFLVKNRTKERKKSR